MTSSVETRPESAAAGPAADSLTETRAHVLAMLARTEGDPAGRERQASFQALIAELAIDFIGLAGSELEAALGHALERIATFAGAERAALVHVESPEGTLRVAHEWANAGPRTPLRSIDGQRDLRWSLEQLRKGNVIRVQDRPDLPPEAVQEGKVWDMFGIRSILAVPVRTREGELLGFATFATLTKRAAWGDDELPLFDLAAEMLRSAFEQQRLRSELERSELRLRKLLDSGAIGIVAADAEGRIWEANEVALTVLGFTRSDMEAGRLRWDRLTPAEYRPMTMSALEQLETSGSCDPWEQDIYRPDGSRVSILLCLARIAETPAKFLIYAVDITADKTVERVLALRNRLSRLITLFSTRLIAVPASRIGETMEEALREIGGVLGLDRSTVWIDLEGNSNKSRCTHVWDRSGPHDPGIRIPDVARSRFSQWAEHFRHRHPMVVTDTRLEFAEGTPERIFLEMHGARSGIAVPLIADSKPVGFVTFSTERVVEWPESIVSLLCVIGEIFAAAIARGRIEDKQRRVHAELEARIAERTVQLESANRELEAFSYAVSHDLRAPLRSVDGFSRILVEDHSEHLPAAAKAVLDRVRATSQRMGELIDALLKLSRITRSEPTFEKTDLSAIVRDLAAGLSLANPERQVELRIEDGIVIDGEPRLLAAMMDNLLRNAWKFTRDRPQAHIEFGCERSASGRVYFVRDDGVGFDPSQSVRLFTPFQRLHDPREFEGHGVGLATVKRIVVLHGGRVWGSGEPNKGATIRFTLAGRA